MKGRPILIVEDNEDHALLLQRAFTKAEPTIALFVVDNGDAAIAYLSGDGSYADRTEFPLPTLLLLDLKLSGRSGLEVLAWLRQQRGLKRLPVIAFTTSQQPDDVDRAYDLGANAYLIKPARFDHLLAQVQALQRFWLAWNIPPRTPGAGSGDG
jgi:DNA-binding response OmpR family regulator